MKKLSTILFTTLFLLLSINLSFAVCSRNLGFGNVTMSEAQIYYTDSTGYHTTNAVIRPPATYVDLTNIDYLNQINVYFNQISFSGKYMQFTGSVSLQNLTPNSFDNIFPLSITSPEPILSNGFAGSYCESLGGTQNSTVSRMTDGTTTYVVATYPFNVKCYNPLSDPIIGLKFMPNYGSLANLHFNNSFRVSAYVNPEYTYFSGDYDLEFCQLQNAIENISINSSGATSSDITNQTQQIINNNNSNTQDIINNNNNNTQQIVDQLTSESCSQVSCSNLFHPIGNVTAPSSGAMGDSYVEFNNTWGTQDLNIRNSQTIFTLERNKTYYYNLVCDHDNLYNIKFGSSSGNYTSNMSCGTGNFTWNLPDTNIDIVVVSVTYLGTATSVRYRIDIYVSETDGEFCNYGSTIEECSGSNRLDNINNSITDVNNTLNNSSTSQADNKMSDIIENFQAPDYGFAEFIYLPFNFFRLILNPVCQPIQLQVPYVTRNTTITLPCYNTILQQNFPELMTLIHIVTDGLIVYYCCVTIFRTAQTVLDPEKANLEVFEL